MDALHTITRELDSALGVAGDISRAGMFAAGLVLRVTIAASKIPVRLVQDRFEDSLSGLPPTAGEQPLGEVDVVLRRHAKAS